MDIEIRKSAERQTVMLCKAAAMLEEGGEVVVPDSKPDIARILTTFARAEARREIRGGKVYCEGVIRTSTLYVPESGKGLAYVELGIPFSNVFDVADKIEGKNAAAFVSAGVVESSARELNPRKISVRVGLRLTCECYAPTELLISGGTDEKSCETKLETVNARFLLGVYEKLQSVTDSAELPDSRLRDAELVWTSADVHTGESRMIPNKVIVKGEIEAKITALRGDELCAERATIPFAAVVDAEGADEGKGCDISYTVSECDFALAEENGTGRFLLSAKLNLSTHVSVWEEKQLVFLEDAYATSGALGCTYSECELAAAGKQTVVRTQQTERVETGAAVASVALCTASGGAASYSAGKSLGEVKLDAVFADRDGSFYHAGRTAALELAAEDTGVAATDVEISELSYHITADEEIEFKFTAVWHMAPVSNISLRQISAMTLEPEADAGRKPSAVLCYAENGESIWDLGKRMRASAADIAAANAIEGDKLPRERMILIPSGHGEVR